MTVKKGILLRNDHFNLEEIIKSTLYLYLLHEFADFLNRGFFEFQKFRLFKKLLLHVTKLTLKILQPLPPLLTESTQRSDEEEDQGKRRNYTTTKIKGQNKLTLND